MQTIQINQKNIETGTGFSSKGNQLKWEIEDYWYKADAFGYEGLSEVMAAELLKHSNIKNIVEYEPVWIIYEDMIKTGCRSHNFKKEKQEIIPLEKLSRTCTGFGLAKELGRMNDVKQRILYTVELVENITGLDHFGEYLTKMLEIDAFFLNEDRHTNNIAVLYNLETGDYELCPFFDMGLSLYSDVREMYPMEKSLPECRKTIHAKPFSRDFDEQLDAANELYGSFLRFDFPYQKMRNLCEKAEKQLTKEAQKEQQQWYSREELERVKETLVYQAQKYQYLFC